jgi:predicted GTPase
MTMMPSRAEGPRRVVIMGAAGRDFHNFNVAFRDDPSVKVVAFTAAQIPSIAGRRYPQELAGPRHPGGIPIHSEAELSRLIKALLVDEVIFAYSDVSHEEVMRAASLVLAGGADFRLMGPDSTMLAASVPVVSVCATRTGAGKSQTARRVSSLLTAAGVNVAVVHHPMPYGDLARQAVQRFTDSSDLDEAACTVEEREEYEPHLRDGRLVFAGVDYALILEAAQMEANVIVWDGGNNDLPFYRPDLHIVVTDPLRAGDEIRYHPGQTNLLAADVVVVNKVDSADDDRVEAVMASVKALNPEATVIKAASRIFVDRPDEISGRSVLVVEDGPTLTHGGLPSGAGLVAARRHGAREVVDPRPYAEGAIAELYQSYAIGPVLPAVAFTPSELAELEATIGRCPADVVVVATPADLTGLIHLGRPTVRVSYELAEIGTPTLESVLVNVVDNLRGSSPQGGS